MKEQTDFESNQKKIIKKMNRHFFIQRRWMSFNKDF